MGKGKRDYTFWVSSRVSKNIHLKYILLCRFWILHQFADMDELDKHTEMKKHEEIFGK